MRSGKLRLGVLDMCRVLDPAKKPAEGVEESLELARFVEDLGYSRYWVTEHHDPRSTHGSPPTMLSLLASRTRRMKVGTGCILLRYFPPLRVANDFRLLEALYPGRVELGVGQGGPPGAMGEAVAGGKFIPGRSPDYYRRISELLDYLRGADPDEEELDAEARPEGRSPPVWLMGVAHHRMAFAARHGTGLAFSMFFDRRGISPLPWLKAHYYPNFRPSAEFPRPALNVSVHVVCAEDAEEAERLAAPANENRYAFNFWGTPDHCARRLQTIGESFGTRDFLIQTLCDDFEARKRSYRLLSEAVDRLSREREERAAAPAAPVATPKSVA